jgi:hypothetical protein
MSARLGAAFLLDLAGILVFLGAFPLRGTAELALMSAAFALAAIGNALGWSATRGQEPSTGFGLAAVCAALAVPGPLLGLFAFLAVFIGGVAQGCTWIWIAASASPGARSRVPAIVAAAWQFLAAPVVLIMLAGRSGSGSAHAGFHLCIAGLSGLALYAALRGRGSMGIIMLAPLAVMTVLDVAGDIAVPVTVVLASAAAAMWACARLRTLASPLAALLAGLLGGALAAIPVDARALPFAVEILAPLAAAVAWLAAARLAPSRRVLDGIAITAGIALAAVPVGGDHHSGAWAAAVALRALFLVALLVRIGRVRPTTVPTMTARAA